MASIARRPRKLLSPTTPRFTRARIREDRRRRADKARLSRRRIDRIHRQFPAPIHDVFDPLAPTFTEIRRAGLREPTPLG